MNSSLTEGQLKYVDYMTDGYIYTNAELAELCDVAERTVYRWRTNPRITEAINVNADATMGQYITQANRTLIEVLEDGSEHARLKAVDMLYKSLGKYKDNIEITSNDTQTMEERQALLLARLKPNS